MSQHRESSTSTVQSSRIRPESLGWIHHHYRTGDELEPIADASRGAVNGSCTEVIHSHQHLSFSGYRLVVCK